MNPSSEPEHVQGRIVGFRGPLMRASQLVSVLPDPLGLLERASQLVPAMRWGCLIMQINDERALVDFVGAHSGTRLTPRHKLRVVRMAPDPVRFLWNHLSTAGRRLDASSSVPVPPTADIAWELARLRALFDEVDEAARAVRQGLEHLRASHGTTMTVDDLRLLQEQLHICMCKDAARDLRTYLDDLPQ
ncbi:hypothetical protein [Geodermatophilus saharensis]|uniref:hypothetical protein n=1 Tax=Geodermatophilus saharensis TaxID=1137994 RepID=UPI0011404C92|nr:hypothetical protein [Geodermatophilus saharensis]